MSYASELKRKEIGSYWANPQTYATSLMALAVDEFGTDCFVWEPQTVQLEVKDLYKVQIPQVNIDKFLALVTTQVTNLFYTSVESFSHIANALNGSEADFNSWDPVDADEAAWAITEVIMNDPLQANEDLGSRFSAEVLRYLGVILESEGITTPPDVLRIADMSARTQPSDMTFADDPEIYGGFHKLSQSKSKDIVDYVRGNIAYLISQLSKLPLQSRDQQRWDAFAARTQKKVAK